MTAPCTISEFYLPHVMFSFTCQLTELSNTQIAGKTLFLGVSLRVFPEEISVQIGELSEADGPPQCR